MSERFNYLTLVELASLRMALEPIEKGFQDSLGIYQVGSSLVRADYRDVDIRLILHDARFEHLFGSTKATTGHVDFWTITCLALSEWIRHRTGLPVDFQIQSMTQAQEHKGEPRTGMFLTYESQNT